MTDTPPEWRPWSDAETLAPSKLDLGTDWRDVECQSVAYVHRALAGGQGAALASLVYLDHQWGSERRFTCADKLLAERATAYACVAVKPGERHQMTGFGLGGSLAANPKCLNST